MDKVGKLSALAVFVAVMSSSAGAASLDATVSQALLDHPQVKQAYDNYVTRTHQIDQAKAGYFPKVDAVAGIGKDNYDSNSSDTDGSNLNRQEFGISLTQMLFDGFATSSNVDRT